MRQARGFTLIEVLLATVLLAAGLALALTTLRAATATVDRGEALSQRSERMRAVAGFLRRRIASAQQIAFQTDEGTGEIAQFIGEPQRLRWVADLPDYLGQGGPHLHDIAVDDSGRAQRLTVAFGMVMTGRTIEPEDPRPPETLVDDLTSLRLRYRGFDETGALGAWNERWGPSALPLQVEVSIETERDGAWPVLVVTLPQGTGQPGAELQP
ncbi:prepilin-type N-terminal cleavage/methylation domain-containing protein [Luteimonas sp. 100069]|uniref:prepilin-type N-terminal cleavage/methylation domain-containing protein n=1 Tax=Luteimonas sp. 100069 TaxID=2006109 RepID=UPI000F4EFE9D|nr:prepilin-type N-terminal cleavage/methylation domain-containing protein [Luteimonas sp. 100069]RPD84514.1 prepilin-type N-terminal cleavage/methylation domain-containing protein [Luteimonas sp. 100069]